MQSIALQCWLQLSLTWKLNAATLKALLAHTGSVEALLDLSPTALPLADLRDSALAAFTAWQQGHTDAATRQQVESCLRWGELPGNSILALGNSNYPPLLATCSDPPAQLFVRGQVECLHLPQFAIVGSRKPTVDGRRHARRFASELVHSGFHITSGLALGIDSESHRSALDAGGVTVAVLGSGVANVYPKCHWALAEQIVERGALVSEFPPAAKAEPWHFPERNRVISGLAHGVLVVEAAEQSGSLITARLGAEQGREVFAIPGSINNALARGCHRLLRQGAHLVESLEDILVELPALVAWQRGATTTGTIPVAAAPVLSKQQQALLAAIGYDHVPLDTLQQRCQLAVPELLAALTTLELLGCIELQPQGYVLLGRR